MPIGKQIHILLADDDKDDTFFFAKALEKVPFPISFTSLDDGEELLTYLTNGKSVVPDVLFLDVNMPRKNGMECLIEIKVNKKIKDFAIVIYSTSLNPSVAELFYEKGAHSCLKKCDFKDLIGNLTTIISQISKNEFVKQPREKFVL